MQYIFLRIYFNEMVVEIIKLVPNIGIVSGKWNLRPGTIGGT